MKRILVGIAVGALALAGCGSSDSQSAPQSVSSAQAQAAVAARAKAAANAKAKQEAAVKGAAKVKTAAEAKVAHAKAVAQAQAVAQAKAVAHAQAVDRQAKADAARAQQKAAQHAQAVTDAKLRAHKRAVAKANAAKKVDVKHTRKAPQGRAACRLAPDDATLYPAECGPGAGHNQGCGDLSVPQGHNWNCSNYLGVLDPRNDKRQTVPGNAPWSAARCATADMGDHYAHCK